MPPSIRRSCSFGQLWTVFGQQRTNHFLPQSASIPACSDFPGAPKDLSASFSTGLENQPRFKLMQTKFQARRILMRIDESFDSRMKAAKLLDHSLACGFQRRRLINQASLAEDRHEQVFRCGVGWKMFAAGRIGWVRNDKRIWHRNTDIVYGVADKFFFRSKTA